MDSEPDPYEVCGITCLAAKKLGFLVSHRIIFDSHQYIFMSPQGDQITGGGMDKQSALLNTCNRLNQFFQFNGR